MSAALTPVERDYLRASRRASKVPDKVTSPSTVAQIAAMLTRPREQVAEK